MIGVGPKSFLSYIAWLASSANDTISSGDERHPLYGRRCGLCLALGLCSGIASSGNTDFDHGTRGRKVRHLADFNDGLVDILSVDPVRRHAHDCEPTVGSGSFSK